MTDSTAPDDGADSAKTAALRVLVGFHRAVDDASRELELANAGRLACGRGCADCCTDGLSVFGVEAERIRREAADLLRSGVPHPPGKCAFLDHEGACRIYAARPYVCRTQGLPLRWIEQEGDAAVVERRDICPLNDSEAEPLVGLSEELFWTLGPHEDFLYDLAERFEGAAPARQGLRTLFENRFESFGV